MMSVPAFIMLESGFTAVQFAVVAPLIALASRESA
jgi:Flp pilus assembly pilin Flp